MNNPPPNLALELAMAKGLLRARDLAQVGARGGTLQKFLREGLLVRVSRGLYAVPGNWHAQEPNTLSQISVSHPKLVYCLLTALELHGITTQSPHEVWVAIPRKSRAPRINHPPLKVIRLSSSMLHVCQMSIDGVVQISVTSVAKTVVDCFKFRNKVGLDVALEALREAWQKKKVTMDELWEVAASCRMTNVMRPYLESLV